MQPLPIVSAPCFKTHSFTLASSLLREFQSYLVVLNIKFEMNSRDLFRPPEVRHLFEIPNCDCRASLLILSELSFESRTSSGKVDKSIGRLLRPHTLFPQFDRVDLAILSSLLFYGPLQLERSYSSQC